MKIVKYTVLLLFSLSNIMHATDAEKIIVQYDNLGNKNKSPSLIRGKHIPVWMGKKTPEYSIAYDKDKVILEYNNLFPDIPYRVKVTTVSSSKRVQRLTGNGKYIYDNRTLSLKPETNSYMLPKGIIGKDGKLVLEFINIEGTNTVVSEVTLFVNSDKAEYLQTHSGTSKNFLNGNLTKIVIPSSLDKVEQDCIVLSPPNINNNKCPLIVALHSWSGNYKQKVTTYGPLAIAKGCYAIFPDYRGKNIGNLKAMGSKYAVQDIIDAVEYMTKNYPIDNMRIYIIGASGGGHMALLMAGKHPEVWAAVSAWCPVSDIALWYKQNPNYAHSIKSCIGASPGESIETDKEYMMRSPITFIDNAKNIPIQIFHGTKDSIIPIEQTDQLIKKMGKLKLNVEYIREDAGHILNPEKMINFVLKYHQKLKDKK